MQAMGNLSHKHKLTARTSAEVVEGVDLLLARRRFSAVKFRGRKIGKESLAGAVMLEFLQLPEPDHLAILERRLPQLEAQIEAGQDVETPPVDGRLVQLSYGRLASIGPQSTSPAGPIVLLKTFDAAPHLTLPLAHISIRAARHASEKNPHNRRMGAGSPRTTRVRPPRGAGAGETMHEHD